MSRSLTAAERRTIAGHRTPHAVQGWLRGLRYNWERSGPTLRSFRSVVRHRSAHCLEAAIAAATLLEFHGFPPLLLDLESRDLLDHVVFAYRQDGRWGSVGVSRDVGLRGRRPVFRSLRRLAMSYYEPYIDLRARIEAFALADLRNLGGYDWRCSTRNVWRVERWLISIEHTPLVTDDRRYIRLRERYREFARTHDPLDTPFKRGAQHWM